MQNFKIILPTIFILFAFTLSFEIRKLENDTEALNFTSTHDDDDDDDNNKTAQNLYVIRAVVYEIGILTNVDENDTSSTNETLTNERIDLTFFQPDKNGSIIDLGNIPLPVQTNISGHIVTGIAPVDIGTIENSDFSSINISESLLPGASIGNAIKQLVPSTPLLNMTDNLINNIDSNISPESFDNLTTNIKINNMTSDEISVSPLNSFGSVFEPLKLVFVNKSTSISKLG